MKSRTLHLSSNLHFAASYCILLTVSYASKVRYALYSPRYIKSKTMMIEEIVRLCHKLEILIPVDSVEVEGDSLSGGMN